MIFLAAMVITAGLALYRFNPADFWFWPKCPVKLLTGLSCPACGIQRFVHAIANGHPLEAIAYNYYLAYALPYTIAVAGTWMLPHSRLKERLTGIVQSQTAIWLYIVSFCVWFAVRNILKI